MIPGNHDSSESLRQVLPELVADEEGPTTFSLKAGDWRLIGLDTHIPDKVSGRIGAEQLEWLKGKLTAHSREPTIIFMHHPPIPVNSAWLDRLGLEEPKELVETITSKGRTHAAMQIQKLHVVRMVLGRDLECFQSVTKTVAIGRRKSTTSYHCPQVPGGLVLSESETRDSTRAKVESTRTVLDAFELAK